jgi:hypothetical protein
MMSKNFNQTSENLDQESRCDMNLPFLRRDRHLTALHPPLHDEGHQVSSTFSYSLCRFVLECSCGAEFDTPYIDEALEYRELHERLGPLADEMAAL